MYMQNGLFVCVPWEPLGPWGCAHVWPHGLRISLMGELAWMCAQAFVPCSPAEQPLYMPILAQTPDQPIPLPLGFLPKVEPGLPGTSEHLLSW